MDRIILNDKSVKITRNDKNTVNIVLQDGTIYENLEPRKLFPVSLEFKYITLLDENNSEIALIEDLDNLEEEAKQTILDCLEEYYLVPQILKLKARSEKFNVLKWTVLTDRGEVTFVIQNRQSDIKAFFDGRVLVRDSNDNRYEIKNIDDLDKASKKLLNMDL